MKLIPLSNRENTFAICDDDDYDELSKWKWSMNNVGYVQGSPTTMHRYVMKAQKGQEIDHINRDKLDNRKANLRFVNRQENMRNRDMRNRENGGSFGSVKAATTIYGKWRSYRYVNGRYQHLAVYDTKEEALAHIVA